MGLVLYPYFLLVFWYKDFFLSFVRQSWEILIYAANLLSVPILIKTFFKPLKNEYREGLVVFSIFMGIFIKLILLSVSLAFIAVLVLVLILINLVILLLPFLIVRFLFL